MPKDIVDEIDALVDWQLSKPIVDDYNTNRFPKCWHCSRDEHHMPVTEKIAEMYGRGVFDDDYRAADDDSKILCPGSDFIGPVVQQPGWRDSQQPGWRDSSWMERLAAGLSGADATVTFWDHHYRRIDQRRWWRTQLPSDARIELQREPNRITLEIGDDAASFDAENVRFQYEHDETTIHQSSIRRTMSGRRTMMDVLIDNAPNIGGTWTPLTAPGVTLHPDEQQQQQIQRFTFTAAWPDDGSTIAAAVRDWSWDEPRPRTRAEILERRQQVHAAREQQLDQFRHRPDAR